MGIKNNKEQITTSNLITIKKTLNHMYNLINNNPEEYNINRELVKQLITSFQQTVYGKENIEWICFIYQVKVEALCSKTIMYEDIQLILMNKNSIDIFDEKMKNIYPFLYESVWDKSIFEKKAVRENIRDLFTYEISWSIPDKKSIDITTKYSQGKILSVGSGRGLWEAFIKKQKEIIATDINPPFETFLDVEQISGTDAIKKYEDHTTLFLNWPPYRTSLAYDCITNFKGNTLIYVGERENGCTADKKFFDVLEKDWKCILSYEIIRWYDINDSIFVYQKIH
jgi:hypothetical protein